jgi:pimeloyl-ACP methyl ester carboxylesterase
MPNCKLVTVAESGHPVPLDNPDGFIAAVKPFLLS